MPADIGDLTELVAPLLLLTDPDDLLTGEVRVTVETEEVASVVVASVSTEAVAAGAFVDEAMAVSAAAWSGRAHPEVKVAAASAPASDSLIIDRFLE